MTETAIFPGSQTSGPQTTEPVEETEDGSRRKLMLVGGGAGVVVLAAAAYFLLHGSSGSPAPVLAPVAHPSVAPSQPATHVAAAGHGKPAVAKVVAASVRHHKVTRARDPFQALIVAPVTAGTSTGTTTVPAASPAPITTSTPAPVTSVAPVTSTPPAPTTGRGHGIPAGHPLWIQLVNTHGTKTATFKVGYPRHKFHVFRVGAPSASSQQGTVFGGEFDLIGIQDGEATVQIGDAKPFDLAKGVAHVIG
jgi:hypothetical protein